MSRYAEPKHESIFWETPLNISRPSLQAQSTSSPGALRHVWKPTSIPIAAQPLIHPPVIKFGPFHLSSSALGSHPTCDTSCTPTTAQGQPCGTSSPLEMQSHVPPPITRAAQQQVQLKAIPPREASTESPSNGSNEALARSVHKKSVEKGTGTNQGKKKKAHKPSNNTSSRSSWNDRITFDAKEEVLTIDDEGNEEVING